MRALALLMCLFALPALAADKHSGDAPTDGFYLTRWFSDGTIGAGDRANFCLKTSQANSAIGEGCNWPRDVTITAFSVTAKNNLNATTEECTLRLVVAGVEQSASNIIVGTDTTAACDYIHPLGDTDVSTGGDSCTVLVNIEVDAGVGLEVGFFAGPSTACTALQDVDFTVSGVYR